MKYAVVDIETTGGTPAGSRITEICVVVTDGYKVYHRFETLLNPGSPIPRGITALTGITNEMVAHAPVFADIAGELHHILHDKIFVAHNVNFDYGFIHREFEQLGVPFSPQKACSARAARKAFPGKRSYSLGSICQALGIEIFNRHRAGGDADATAILIQRIIESGGEDHLLEQAGRSTGQLVLPPGVDIEQIDRLPATPGVYYFLNTSGKPLYIGKAINIRKRVLQHFDRKRGKTALQLEKVAHIDFEETGNEFMALLSEAEAISRHWPEWNKAGKYATARYAVVSYATANGEFRLQAARRFRGSSEGIPYSRLGDARAALSRMISENGICASRAFSSKGCQDETCYCREEPKQRREIHNSRVMQAIESMLQPQNNLLLLGRGRHADETGIVHIADGAVMGWGFSESVPADPSPDHLVKKVKDLAETRAIAGSFLRRILGGSLHGYRIIQLNPEDHAVTVYSEPSDSITVFRENEETVTGSTGGKSTKKQASSGGSRKNRSKK